MKIYRDTDNYRTHDIRNWFWSGGADTVEDLRDDEIELILTMLRESSPEGLSDTEVNDFFWFERDTIADWLGYSSYEEIMNRKE